MIMILDL